MLGYSVFKELVCPKLQSALQPNQNPKNTPAPTTLLQGRHRALEADQASGAQRHYPSLQRTVGTLTRNWVGPRSVATAKSRSTPRCKVFTESLSTSAVCRLSTSFLPAADFRWTALLSGLFGLPSRLPASRFPCGAAKVARFFRESSPYEELFFAARKIPCFQAFADQ